MYDFRSLEDKVADIEAQIPAAIEAVRSVGNAYIRLITEGLAQLDDNPAQSGLPWNDWSFGEPTSVHTAHLLLDDKRRGLSKLAARKDSLTKALAAMPKPKLFTLPNGKTADMRDFLFTYDYGIDDSTYWRVASALTITSVEKSTRRGGYVFAFTLDDGRKRTYDTKDIDYMAVRNTKGLNCQHETYPAGKGTYLYCVSYLFGPIAQYIKENR